MSLVVRPVQGRRDIREFIELPFRLHSTSPVWVPPLRIERHSENALKVAQWLQDRPEIEWVSYPGLQAHPSYDIAKQVLKGGFGGLVTFGIKGGADAGRKLIDNVKLFSLLANVATSSAVMPVPMSGRGMFMRRAHASSNTCDRAATTRLTATSSVRAMCHSSHTIELRRSRGRRRICASDSPASQRSTPSRPETSAA